VYVANALDTASLSEGAIISERASQYVHGHQIQAWTEHLQASEKVLPSASIQADTQSSKSLTRDKNPTHWLWQADRPTRKAIRIVPANIFLFKVNVTEVVFEEASDVRSAG
jgi:hypothetical protein